METLLLAWGWLYISTVGKSNLSRNESFPGSDLKAHRWEEKFLRLALVAIVLYMQWMGIFFAKRERMSCTMETLDGKAGRSANQ
jgi:hypothetical protein